MSQKNVSPLYIVIYKEGKRFSGTPGTSNHLDWVMLLWMRIPKLFFFVTLEILWLLKLMSSKEAVHNLGNYWLFYINSYYKILQAFNFILPSCQHSYSYYYYAFLDDSGHIQKKNFSMRQVTLVSPTVAYVIMWKCKSSHNILDWSLPFMKNMLNSIKSIY